MRDIPPWIEHLHGAEIIDHLSEDFTSPTHTTVREAAVLVLLSGDPHATQLPEDASVVLEHRNPSMRSHSGQIAFPGGHHEVGDLTIVHTALREAYEEVGLESTTVTPVAKLTPVHIRVSNYPIHPIVAYWNEPTPLTAASPDEVDDVFAAPLSELLNPDNRFITHFPGYQGATFMVRDYLVWGFTAGILDALFSAAGWEEPWDRGRVIPLDEALAHSRNGEIMP
ncbi:MAG: CoA pyrophosphatase [Corynebacterium sp.]|nr:CoA pyrophosphatase [Corynebacterium sp.]